jgi:hypothetical protein
MSPEQAAAILVHYVKRVAAASGLHLTAADHEKLNAAIAAFADQPVKE